MWFCAWIRCILCGMNNVGVIGYGFVGQALGEGLTKLGDKVHWYDKFKESESLEDVVTVCDWVFLCLPTPFRGEDIDLRIIEENLDLIAKMDIDLSSKVFVVKSTVVPGTTEGFAKKYPNLRFGVNPEFLREKHYLEDFMNPDRTVVGADNDEILTKLVAFYEERFPGVPVFASDTKTAEMVKYMSNTFLATKVIFANEMFDLCEKMGMNYEQVREAVVADSRIGKSHLQVTPERGFGEKCFPKDLIALMGVYKKLGVDVSLLDTVWSKNLRIRKVKDWEDIPFVKSED